MYDEKMDENYKDGSDGLVVVRTVERYFSRFRGRFSLFRVPFSHFSVIVLHLPRSFSYFFRDRSPCLIILDKKSGEGFWRTPYTVDENIIF